MNNLISMAGEMTMGTREIAEMLGKNHADIKRSAERLHQSSVIGDGQPMAEPDANTSAALIADILIRLRDCPDHFSADELADLNKLTDAELTKRDAAVCGGEKYLDAHWFERGALPPVGSNVTIVEIDGIGMTDLGREFIGEECKVMAAFVRHAVFHDDEAAIVAVMEPAGGCCCFRLELVKPIRTEHEQLTSIIDGGKRVLAAPEAIADAILAAGFKREGGAA